MIRQRPWIFRDIYCQPILATALVTVKASKAARRLRSAPGRYRWSDEK